jgi:hypothetical protein
MSTETARLTGGEKGHLAISDESSATRRTRPARGATADAADDDVSDAARAGASDALTAGNRRPDGGTPPSEKWLEKSNDRSQVENGAVNGETARAKSHTAAIFRTMPQHERAKRTPAREASAAHTREEVSPFSGPHNKDVLQKCFDRETSDINVGPAGRRPAPAARTRSLTTRLCVRSGFPVVRRSLIHTKMIEY